MGGSQSAPSEYSTPSERENNPNTKQYQLLSQCFVHINRAMQNLIILVFKQKAVQEDYKFLLSNHFNDLLSKDLTKYGENSKKHEKKRLLLSMV